MRAVDLLLSGTRDLPFALPRLVEMFVHYIKTLLFISLTCLGRYSCTPDITDDWYPPVHDDPYFIWQRGDRDCSIAAATTLLRLSGRSISYDEVATYLKPGAGGVDMQTLSAVTDQFGLLTEGYRFRSLDLPSILQQRFWIGLLGSGITGHYVVVRNIIGDTIIVYDPLVGRRMMKRNRFESAWTGYALVAAEKASGSSGRFGDRGIAY